MGSPTGQKGSNMSDPTRTPSRWIAGIALIASLAVAACNDEPTDSERLAKRIEDLSDAACACDSVACANEMPTRLRALIANQAKPEPAAHQRMRVAVSRINTCVTEVALRSARE
jgi:hypothetical protein